MYLYLCIYVAACHWKNWPSGANSACHTSESVYSMNVKRRFGDIKRCCVVDLLCLTVQCLPALYPQRQTATHLPKSPQGRSTH